MPKQPKSRNHAGLATKKPIALRMTPSDRDEAVLISERLGVSMSLLAYRAYRAGLPVVIADNESPASTPSSKPRAKRGNSRGGAAKPRAAASLSK